MSMELWRKVMAVDLDGVLLGTQKAVQVMREQDVRGSIVNMSSAVAYVSAHKIDVRINTIHPGTHLTAILEDQLPNLPEGFLEGELGRHPIGHFGDPVGVAGTFSFLLTDEAEFYQGAEFVIDGGRLSVDR